MIFALFPFKQISFLRFTKSGFSSIIVTDMKVLFPLTFNRHAIIWKEEIKEEITF